MLLHFLSLSPTLFLTASLTLFVTLSLTLSVILSLFRDTYFVLLIWSDSLHFITLRVIFHTLTLILTLTLPLILILTQP